MASHGQHHAYRGANASSGPGAVLERLAPPAGAQSPAAATPPPNTITVNGSAQVEPKPIDRRSNASIKKAVAKARAKAVPRAIANGRSRAANLSQLSGIALGALISIAEAPSSPFFYPGPFNEDGSFNPGALADTPGTQRPSLLESVFSRAASSSSITRRLRVSATVSRGRFGSVGVVMP
jgi:hypothetical protein